MPEKNRNGSVQHRAQRLEERYGKIGISAVSAATQYIGRRPTMRRSTKNAGPTSVPNKKQKDPTGS
jgi:hypothetical protein